MGLSFTKKRRNLYGVAAIALLILTILVISLTYSYEKVTTIEDCVVDNCCLTLVFRSLLVLWRNLHRVYRGFPVDAVPGRPRLLLWPDGGEHGG